MGAGTFPIDGNATVRRTGVRGSSRCRQKGSCRSLPNRVWIDANLLAQGAKVDPYPNMGREEQLIEACKNHDEIKVRHLLGIHKSWDMETFRKARDAALEATGLVCLRMIMRLPNAHVREEAEANLRAWGGLGMAEEVKETLDAQPKEHWKKHGLQKEIADAVRYSRPDILALMLEAGGNPNNKEGLRSAIRARFQCLKLLLDHGAEPCGEPTQNTIGSSKAEPKDPDRPDKLWGNELLMTAGWGSKKEEIDILCQKIVEYRGYLQGGREALKEAASAGNLEGANTLVSHGACPREFGILKAAGLRNQKTFVRRWLQKHYSEEDLETTLTEASKGKVLITGESKLEVHLQEILREIKQRKLERKLRPAKQETGMEI
jgi:hypothetical protein